MVCFGFKQNIKFVGNVAGRIKASFYGTHNLGSIPSLDRVVASLDKVLYDNNYPHLVVSNNKQKYY